MKISKTVHYFQSLPISSRDARKKIPFKYAKLLTSTVYGHVKVTLTLLTIPCVLSILAIFRFYALGSVRPSIRSFVRPSVRLSVCL